MKLAHKGRNIITTRNTISVEIELEAYKKMQCYIDVCNKEVGWLGTAYKEGNVVRITDVFLFEQEVHATTCELTPGGIADFITNLYMTIDTDEAMEISNNLTCWGHSHVNMGVSPSAQDDIQLRSFSTSGHDWFIRVIGNKKGEFEYTYIDYNTGVEIKDLDWKVIVPGLEMVSLKEEIRQEVASKVKDKPIYQTWSANKNLNLNRHKFETMYPTRPKNYVSTSDGYECLVGYDYFDSYIEEQQALFDMEQQKKEIKVNKASIIEEEENILARMQASSNHDMIMNISGNNTDLITDTEYQILDEALCHLTLDELAHISNYEELEDASAYIKAAVSDYFTDIEIAELHTICKNYSKNLNFLIGETV